MLFLSEEDRDRLRGIQSAWQGKADRRRTKKVVPRKLNRDRRAHLVATVARILKSGEPTKFANEAPCRHFIRSQLCLKGWGWTEADATAADIVAAALNSIGARRPTWKQGQPEYTQEGYSPIERTRCIRCGHHLPDGHFKFCGSLCAHAQNLSLLRIRRAEEAGTYDLVAKGAKWLTSKCD